MSAFDRGWPASCREEVIGTLWIIAGFAAIACGFDWWGGLFLVKGAVDIAGAIWLALMAERRRRACSLAADARRALRAFGRAADDFEGYDDRVLVKVECSVRELRAAREAARAL